MTGRARYTVNKQQQKQHATIDLEQLQQHPQIETHWMRERERRWYIIKHMTPQKLLIVSNFKGDVDNILKRSNVHIGHGIDCNLILADWMCVGVRVSSKREIICIRIQSRGKNRTKNLKRVTSIIQVLIWHWHRTVQSYVKLLSSALAQLVNWKVGALVTAFIYFPFPRFE